MKINIKRMWYALSAPDFPGLVLLLMYAIALSGLFYGFVHLSALPLALGGLASAGLIYLTKSGWDVYDIREQIVLEVAASNWLRAERIEETFAPHDAFETTGSLSALTAVDCLMSDRGPSVNIDGTPMVQGSAVDIYGTPYGIANSDSCNSDTEGGMQFDHCMDSSSPHVMD